MVEKALPATRCDEPPAMACGSSCDMMSVTGAQSIRASRAPAAPASPDGVVWHGCDRACLGGASPEYVSALLNMASCIRTCPHLQGRAFGCTTIWLAARYHVLVTGFSPVKAVALLNGAWSRAQGVWQLASSRAGNCPARTAPALCSRIRIWGLPANPGRCCCCEALQCC